MNYDSKKRTGSGESGWGFATPYVPLSTGQILPIGTSSGMSISVFVGRRMALFLAGSIMLLVLAIIAGCHFWIERSTAPHCHEKLDDVPAMKTALVLGCAPTVAGGRPNLFFTKRMEAAAALYQAGKVRALMVSGDNGTRKYDEATAMKEALVKLGVPAKNIHPDYAGFRTLDSVVRAREVFGQSEFIVVSQRFHNERAVFLARQHGIPAVAYDAAAVRHSRALLTHLREWLVRVQVVLDVTVLGTKPKFLGDPVVIP